MVLMFYFPEYLYILECSLLSTVNITWQFYSVKKRPKGKEEQNLQKIKVAQSLHFINF